MSSRNFRKLCGSSLPPPDSDDSEGDYDPLSKNNKSRKSTYEGLVLSSDSDSAKKERYQEDAQDAINSVPQGGARKKKLQKKKSKGKKNKGSVEGTGEKSSSAISHGHQRQVTRRHSRNANEELDEIDKSIMEVNALLGAPPAAPPTSAAPAKSEPIDKILEVQVKYLHVSNELKRLFGPEDAEEIRARTKNQPHRARILKRVMVTPTNDTALYEFKKTGLSMSIDKREGNVTYFVYDHDADHQKMHQAFLTRYAENFTFQRHSSSLARMEEYRKKMHVEPLLEIADTLFHMDENGVANELIENIVTYLQYVAHPSFNLSSRNVRLLYAFRENRPFHVVMLKYIYLLSNKACHRTALEIAKMMLNLDPSDPMAVLFIIDTVALRAREHKWLIEAIDYFNTQREAKTLFNIQYSYALAHYHVAVKNKIDLIEADKHLKLAMMGYPRVVRNILNYSNVTEPRILNHILFRDESNRTASNASAELNDLIMIYARLTWSRWREPNVMDWFLKNAIEVAENYNNSSEARGRAAALATIRNSIFQTWPVEITRHVAVLAPMSNLILETPMPSVHRTEGSSWDPVFGGGINRYEPRDYRAFLMSHLIATSGRTPHLVAFDPAQSFQEMSTSLNMPAVQTYNETMNNRTRTAILVSQEQGHSQNYGLMPGAEQQRASSAQQAEVQLVSKAVDTHDLNVDENNEQENDDEVDGPSIIPDPDEPSPPRNPMGNVFNIHQLEALLNPQPLNGLITNRSGNPNVSVLPINFMNVSNEYIYDADENFDEEYLDEGFELIIDENGQPNNYDPYDLD